MLSLSVNCLHELIYVNPILTPNCEKQKNNKRVTTKGWSHFAKSLRFFSVKTGGGGARVAQCWEHLPPTNVARVQLPASTPYVGKYKFVVGSFPCSERFFSGYSGFPLSSKPNISKFQIDQESGRQRTTLWMCYLQTVIYFIYFISFQLNTWLVYKLSGKSQVQGKNGGGFYSFG